MNDFKKGIYLVSIVISYLFTWVGEIIAVAISANKNLEVLIIALLNALVFGYALNRNIKDNAG